jgi:hypothetical protein
MCILSCDVGGGADCVRETHEWDSEMKVISRKQSEKVIIVITGKICNL